MIPVIIGGYNEIIPMGAVSYIGSRKSFAPMKASPDSLLDYEIVAFMKHNGSIVRLEWCTRGEQKEKLTKWAKFIVAGGSLERSKETSREKIKELDNDKGTDSGGPTRDNPTGRMRD